MSIISVTCVCPSGLVCCCLYPIIVLVFHLVSFCSVGFTGFICFMCYVDNGLSCTISFIAVMGIFGRLDLQMRVD